jgi:hypothetical protein
MGRVVHAKAGEMAAGQKDSPLEQMGERDIFDRLVAYGLEPTCAVVTDPGHREHRPERKPGRAAEDAERSRTHESDKIRDDAELFESASGVVPRLNRHDGVVIEMLRKHNEDAGGESDIGIDEHERGRGCRRLAGVTCPALAGPSVG